MGIFITVRVVALNEAGGVALVAPAPDGSSTHIDVHPRLDHPRSQ
jgi:hypothetical protein